MADVERALFTIGVFKDAEWATRGIAALTKQGFAPAALSILAKDDPLVSSLIESVFGDGPERVDLPVVGPALAKGTLLAALQGVAGDVGRIGMAAAMRRVGFQPHDGLIFESLAGRGGVLVAVEDAPRAADALAILHSYGGGNAAIGAWAGRV
ncbi:MAG: hypothetical protein AB1806_04175 [Acidobacteriota bacterium]